MLSFSHAVTGSSRREVNQTNAVFTFAIYYGTLEFVTKLFLGSDLHNDLFEQVVACI